MPTDKLSKHDFFQKMGNCSINGFAQASLTDAAVPYTREHDFARPARQAPQRQPTILSRL